jgi:hypothetical protein
MKQCKLATSFDESINSLTLCFKDRDDEENYQTAMRYSLHLPLVFRIYTYFIIVCHILFRIASILSASTTNFLKTGTYREELIGSLIMAGGFVVEGCFKLCKRTQQLQGSVLYTTLPMVAIYGTFNTQRAPLIGFPYFPGSWLRTGIVLLATTGTMAVFVKNWMAGCVGNLIITFGTLIMMLIQFHNELPMSMLE